MDRWVHKVAVVTGASAGIGKNVAQRLVQEGLLVVGLARRVEIIEDLSKSLNEKKGKLLAIKCDVSNENEVANAFKWVKANVGPVSILINNAGSVRNNSFIDGTPSIWKQVLDVNLFGTTLCTQQAVQQMMAEDIAGHIININSVVGHKVIDLGSTVSTNIYAASKYGITAFTETMRQELKNRGTKIKITSVSPGFVQTDILNKSGFPNASESSKILQLQNASLCVEDITDAIIYALSTKPHVQVHELIIKPLGEAF